MSKIYMYLGLLLIMASFISACSAQPVKAQSPEQVLPKPANYEDVLGKSMHDKDVTNFITNNYCSDGGQIQLCPSLGLVLWLDSRQRIETVYLYASESSFFAAYTGKLPFRLTMRDNIAVVEQKLGLPDEGVSPDHAYYYAIYKRLGVAVLYNTPSDQDQSATIYAILVSK